MFKRLSIKAVVALAVLPALLFMFQNCAPGPVGSDGLTSSNPAGVCVGINCRPDIMDAMIGFKELVGNSIYIDRPRTGVTPNCNVCDSTTCFDLSGYCETGGYSKSKFYIQWYKNNIRDGGTIEKNVSCDELGRFRFLVNLPNCSSFDYNAFHQIEVKLVVIDSNNSEQSVPNMTKVVTVQPMDQP